jgi:hypothetical protein
MIVDPVTKAAVPVGYADGIIRRLWWRSLNTHEIASFLKLDESFVANRLAVIRDSVHR